MISFTVSGAPIPQGSMVAFMPKNAERPIMHASNNNELKKWRKEVAKSAAVALDGGSAAGKGVALRVTILFILPREWTDKSGNVRRWKNPDCVNKPDLDKLIRAVLDGLTGVVFDDDCQIAELHASKEYGSEPRAEIVVEEVGLVQKEFPLEAVRDRDLPF